MKGCRGVGKKDMKLNDKLPKMTVDPETYEVGKPRARVNKPTPRKKEGNALFALETGTR